ncbi:MAG TPA: peptidylprolyl isomerase [Acidobacteriaceae bacterium]|nr:peptidylprolyl isomerase [Acidobacteriaceae bacterium]
MLTLRRTVLFAAVLLVSGTLFAQQTTPDAPAPAAQTATPAQPPSPQATGPTAVFDTSMGRMVCRLFSKEAPNTVANFIGLATGSKDWTDPRTRQVMHGKPLYDGTIFHRVIPGFMIQGGDPLGTGEGDPGYTFNDEINPSLNFDVAGRLAMANSGPNTNGSQFFITVAATPWLNQHYTIFGQCDDSSVWVAKSITDVNRDSHNKPLEPVVLEKVTIVPAGQPLPPAPPPAAPAPAAPAGAPAPQS